MKFEIVTLFPDYFSLSLKQSLIGKAIDKKLFDIEIINLRDFTTDKHHTADDQPFGGGGGMVMKIEPLDRALASLGYKHKDELPLSSENGRIILTSAAGVKFSQKMAIEFSLGERLTIICGHYLGVDERLLNLYEIEEVSIGDYVLSGGEPAAAVMLDAVARLIPKVLGNFESALNDSHMNQMLGAPCYTRPAEYEGFEVPQALMSGNHAEIERFNKTEAIRKCMKYRPDLLETADLSAEELKIIKKLKKS
jgi:tRNA (guanine37-N1)-methyltransferase